MTLQDKLILNIKDTKSAYIKAYEGIDNATEKHNEELKKIKKEQAQLSADAYSTKLKEEEKRYRKEVADISNNLTSELEKAENQYNDNIRNYYQPAGDLIVDEDVKLLNSGIRLDAVEVEILAEKNRENPTMLRLIDKYRNDNKIKVTTDVEELMNRVKQAGQSEQIIYKNFNMLAGNGIRMANQGMAGTETYSKCKEKINDYFNDAQSNLTEEG